MNKTTLTARVEQWPIAGGFRIARGEKSEATVVTVELTRGGQLGRGECVPYPRYSETPSGVIDAIEALRPELEQGLTREQLQAGLRAGAARNAVDCALWELEARERGLPVWQLAKAAPPAPITTALTIDLGTPEEVSDRARELQQQPWLKLKVDGTRDLERIEALHDAAPNSRLIVDANESWSENQVSQWLPELPRLGVEVLEQPLPAGQDEALSELEHSVVVCADESFHDRDSFDAIVDRYDAVNLKLDKCGGLTKAILIASEARARRLKLMLGCMVSTSLCIAPAMLLAPAADYVDLDGPLLLARDRDGGLHELPDGTFACHESFWG